jgi:aminoglycoside 6-adenylyltransferase
VRNEKEMLDLILEVARKDEAIRAVAMNGSRVNSNAPRDPFQDFDIIYFVTDMARFISNLEWIKQFGELMILQMPETMLNPPPSFEDGFAYLMQFADGNRIDLNVLPLAKLGRVYSDSLTILLLDKDDKVKSLPAATDKSYLPAPPSAKAFSDCCNEFWWVSTYVAKALWRGNFFHAKDLMDCMVREQLMKMLDWYFGLKTNFDVSAGKGRRNFSKYLDEYLMEILKQTYAGIDPEEIWDSLFAMTTLFRKTGREIANKFKLQYPVEDDKKVTAHLEHVRRLSSDAAEIY